MSDQPPSPRVWPRVFLLLEGDDTAMSEILSPEELVENWGPVGIDVARGQVVDGARVVADRDAKTAIVRTVQGGDIFRITYWPTAANIPDDVFAVMEARSVAKAKLHDLPVVTRRIIGSKTRARRFQNAWRYVPVADYVVVPHLVDELGCDVGLLR